MERPEAEVRTIQQPPFRGLVRADVPPETLLALAQGYHDDALPAGSQMLNDHEGKYQPFFVPLPNPPGDVLFKHFSHRRLSRVVWPLIGLSRAMHCWRVAAALRAEPSLCAAPVAALERRCGPIVLDSYYVEEWIRPGTCIIESSADCLVGGTRTKEDALRDLAAFVADLHGRGIAHAGLHAGNILEEPGTPPRLLMIDLDAALFRPALSAKQRVELLFDVFEIFAILEEAGDFQRLVADYARAAHMPLSRFEPYLPKAIRRLEEKSRETAEFSEDYRRKRVIKVLTWPPGPYGRGKVPARYVTSWAKLLDQLKSWGLLCAARQRLDAVRDAAPEDWPDQLLEEAAHEEAAIEGMLAKLHHGIERVVEEGIRPLFLGSLPLLADYGHPLGVAALSPFEIAVAPEEIGRASDLLGKEPELQANVTDRLDFVSSHERLSLRAELLLEHAEDFDLCGITVATPVPELGFIYYAARCAAPRPGVDVNAARDLAVFLHTCAEALDEDRLTSLVAELSAQAILWRALRHIRLVTMTCYPSVENALRRATWTE